MNPFDKRVQLLEKWHKDNSLINLDNIAELIFEVWQKSEEDTEERIIKLLEDRLLMAKDEKYGLTAMRVPVDRASAIAVTEALLWFIKGENK